VPIYSGLQRGSAVAQKEGETVDGLIGRCNHERPLYRLRHTETEGFNRNASTFVLILVVDTAYTTFCPGDTATTPGALSVRHHTR
jgi:hypothetical protein